MKPDLPLVTVIMPIRNEADSIARSLGAVLSQDYPHDRMEVLIVDGMSTDGTRAEIARTTAEYPDTPVQVLDNQRQIVPTGMNLALRRAQGEIIVRVDGHCEIAPDYVSHCVKHLMSGAADGVGGPIETVGDGPLSESIATAMSSSFGVGGSAFRTIKDRTILVDTVAFPAYTRKAVEAAGPFDEELVRNQDDEYNYRLRKLGYRILLAPDVRSRYFSRGTLSSLWRQYFQYGYYKVRVLQKHPAQMQPRQFAPPVFVALLISGALLGMCSQFIRHLWTLMVAGYIIVSLTVSWRLASQYRPRHLRLLPMIFATLHLGYGLGFLTGLAKFAVRWRHR